MFGQPVVDSIFEDDNAKNTDDHDDDGGDNGNGTATMAVTKRIIVDLCMCLELFSFQSFFKPVFSWTK